MSDTSIKEFQTLIERMVDNHCLDLHVCLPAKIVSYDHTKQKASVKPLLKRRFKDGDVLSLPIITDVPVGHLNSKKSFIHIPVKPNDKVILIFADYSLDNWLVDGNEHDPNDYRNHDLSDCFAIPMGLDFQHSLPVTNGDNVFVQNDKITVELYPSGKVKIQGASNEMIKVLSDFMQGVIDATVKVDTVVTNATPLNPMLPVLGAQASAPMDAGTKSALGAIKSKLDDFKV